MPGSICDILPSAATLLGVPDAADPLEVTHRYGDVRRVVVVLVDGMGSHLLPTMAPHAPLVAQVLAGSVGHLDELTCTFPSTTPTSLVSLGTAATPGEHGVVGFDVLVPGTDRVLTHILWRDDPDPATWQPVPTWFQRAAAAGIDARVVLPELFLGSGLTEAAYRGARSHGVGKHDDYAEHLVDEVLAAPGLVYGYTASLDTAAHRHGIDSHEWRAAAREVDALLTRLVEHLPPDALLLVTADHGGLNVPKNARVDLDADPHLAAGIRAVAGEPRVRYLHTVDGATDHVLATWQDSAGPDVEVLLRDDAIARGLYGAVRPEHIERIGDVVVICTGDNAVLATKHDPPEIAKLVGFHGGLTPAETTIPLLAVRG